MWAFNWYAQFFGEHARLTAMVEMAVSQDDLFKINAMILDCRFQPVQIAARVAQCGLVGLGAPEECAILLERSDRNNHGLEGCNCHERLFGGAMRKLQGPKMERC